MTKMWMLCFGVVALAVLIQIQATNDNASTVMSTLANGATRSSSEYSGNTSATSEPLTSGAGMNTSQSSTVNSTGRGSSLHYSSSSIFLLPFTITTSTLYLIC